MSKYISLVVLGIAFLGLTSCGGGSKDSNSEKAVVRPHLMSEPRSLNPQIHTSSIGTHLCRHIYQTLLNVDFSSGKLVPVLAKSMPVMEKQENGYVHYTYEIREEARWDDGTPITAKDVAFSFKVLKNPFVDNKHRRSYFDIVVDFLYDDSNERKFTLVYSEPYIQATWSMTDILIIPSYIFDPNGLMANIDLSKLMGQDEETLADENLQNFANDFNSAKYQREPDFVKGSGAYELMEWQTGTRIILNKKKNWWGEALTGEHMYFDAYPKQISYEVINNWAQAISALKLQKIDLMAGMPQKEFLALRESESFMKTFDAFTPPTFGFEYIAFNRQNPALGERDVRQALSWLLDVDKVIETLLYGMGTKTHSPIHPSKSSYNHELEGFGYDPQKALSLLEGAGWKDSDQNGVRDKMIDGKLVELNLRYLYNAGNERRKSIGLMLQEEARKLGVGVELEPKEWSVYIGQRKAKDFDMIIGAWGGASQPNDPKQVWHTSNIATGSNFAGFGNADTDALIDDIRTTLNTDQFDSKMHTLQEIISFDAPYIFLSVLNERIAVNKNYGVKQAYSIRPGYWEGSMK